MAISPGTYRFSVSMNQQMRARLDILAKEYSMTRSALISMLIKKKWEEDSHTDTEIGLNDE